MVVDLIFGFLSFLLSLWGATTLLLGVVSFFMLPTISLVSRFKIFSRFFLKLAAFPLSRAAIVVSEANDIIFKQMSYDSLGFHTITIDGDEKVFEDVDQALHYWLGIRFAFADEEHGILFDPRHAHLGKIKEALDNRGESEYLATQDEWDYWRVKLWKPGVFGLPKTHELVDLSKVQNLIDGGERAEYAERVDRLYQHSRAPFSSDSSAKKFLYPVMGFAISFGGIWFMASQIGLPSTGSDSAVTFSRVLVAASLSGVLTSLRDWLPVGGNGGNGDDDDSSDDSDDSGDSDYTDDGDDSQDSRTLPDIDYRKVAAYLGLIVPPLAVLGGLAAILGPTQTVFAVLTFLLGMVFMLFLTVLSKPSKLLSGGLSNVYFKLALLGYRQPVLEWTPRSYRLREYDSIETTDNVEWYNFQGRLMGVTYRPGPDSWDAEPLSHAEVDALKEPQPDGGEIADSNLPEGKVRSEMQRDIYGGYLPKRLSDRRYYLHSGIALNRFSNSAIGEKALRKLLEAKDEHGTDTGTVDDNLVLKATVVTTLFGALAGIGIFILPALL